jgi:NAD(P)-dependent dehydrogenase (short-subunit alcohol dehydrogenase family)
MNQTTQPTAIVTGAARGIGLATTRLFLSKGLRVAMVDCDLHELQNASTRNVTSPQDI